MKKEMLINVLQPEECRIAIVEDGILEELYVERTSLESYTGNIYKGKIVNLEPAIQAAFRTARQAQVTAELNQGTQFATITFTSDDGNPVTALHVLLSMDSSKSEVEVPIRCGLPGS